MLVLWTAIFSVKEIPGKMRRILRLTTILLAPFVALGIYIGMLFRQLETSFREQREWIPTRLYSDVTRLAPGTSRAQVEELRRRRRQRAVRAIRASLLWALALHPDQCLSG